MLTTSYRTVYSSSFTFFTSSSACRVSHLLFFKKIFPVPSESQASKSLHYAFRSKPVVRCCHYRSERMPASTGTSHEMASRYRSNQETLEFELGGRLLAFLCSIAKDYEPRNSLSQYLLFGPRAFHTLHPKNVEAVLSTNFKGNYSPHYVQVLGNFGERD